MKTDEKEGDRKRKNFYSFHFNGRQYTLTEFRKTNWKNLNQITHYRQFLLENSLNENFFFFFLHQFSL